MNTKHTPAPWTVNPKAKTNIRHGNLTIANCSSTHDGSRAEEEIANAKLIAAAPDLLEALQELLSRFQSSQIGYIKADYVKEKANLAIRKATK